MKKVKLWKRIQKMMGIKFCKHCGERIYEDINERNRYNNIWRHVKDDMWTCCNPKREAEL